MKKKKRLFFNVLRDLIEGWGKIIMSGDFNMVFSKRDMADGMVFKSDTGRKELRGLMEGKNIIDVWRERHEKKIDFYRKQLVGNFLCQTRIDHFLCTRNLNYL